MAKAKRVSKRTAALMVLALVGAMLGLSAYVNHMVAVAVAKARHGRPGKHLEEPQRDR